MFDTSTVIVLGLLGWRASIRVGWSVTTYTRRSAL